MKRRTESHYKKARKRWSKQYFLSVQFITHVMLLTLSGWHGASIPRFKKNETTFRLLSRGRCIIRKSEGTSEMRVFRRRHKRVVAKQNGLRI